MQLLNDLVELAKKAKFGYYDSQEFIAAANPAAILAIAEYVKGLEASLKKANEQTEKFEREMYLMMGKAEDAGEMTNWVKCSEQMPADDTLCLAIDDEGVMWTAHYDCGHMIPDTGDVDDLHFTHWMPLPEAPND